MSFKSRIQTVFTPTRNKQLVTVAVYSLIFTALLYSNARADAITSGVDWLVALLTSGIARGVAIVACAFMGYLAWAGQLTMRQVGMFIAGIIFVFGGATIVDTISSAVN